MSYYNTNSAEGKQLNIFIKKAETQDARILNFFKQNSKIEYGASQVLKLLFDYSVPITSVRRSITNLIKEGKLTYTGRQREGLYGRPERLIKLL